MHGEKGAPTARVPITTESDACRSLLAAVAFGIVCQLVLDGAPAAEVERYLALMLGVGLPVTLAQLGIPGVTDAELRAVAARACAPGETVWNLECAVSEEIVYHAIRGADAVAAGYIRRTGWKSG